MAGRARVELGINVLDAALGRIRWLFEEFDGNVHVATSGGKDSTVTMELAAIVARERGQALHVHFLDQEAEWQSTRDYIRHLKDDRDDLHVDWYQVPFRLYNSTSFGDEWGHMWSHDLAEDEYVRPREPDSIHDNTFGTDRFKDVLRSIHLERGGAHLTGMRVEESPTRRLSATTRPVYKWATWSTSDGGVTQRELRAGAQRFTLFQPIYDWRVSDIWGAIEQHGWTYNRLYDEMFRYGVATRDMRVSSLIHTASVVSLPMVQEIEPETWEALTRRFPGVNSYGHIGEDIEKEFLKKRPYMFDTWYDYFCHLVDTLITVEENRPKFHDMRDEAHRRLPWLGSDDIDREMIHLVMRNNHFKGSQFARWIVAQTQKAERGGLI